MPGPILHVKQLTQCPHGGTIQTTSTNTRVLISGLPVATMTDVSVIAACSFTLPPGTPHPCVKVVWTAPATKVLINGQPALVASSQALCQAVDQAPQGPAMRVPPGPRVTAL